jgi:hypothetical protein
VTCANVTEPIRPDRQHSKEVDLVTMFLVTINLAGPTSGAVCST